MKSFNKRAIWFLILKRINHTIHFSHVLAVINILIEEIINDLLSGKNVKIGNFGTFRISKIKSKKHFSVVHKKNISSSGKRAIRFLIDAKLKKEIKNKI